MPRGNEALPAEAPARVTTPLLRIGAERGEEGDHYVAMQCLRAPTVWKLPRCSGRRARAKTIRIRDHSARAIGPVAQCNAHHGAATWRVKIASDEGKQRHVRNPTTRWDVVQVDRVLAQVRDSEGRGHRMEVARTAQVAEAKGVFGRATTNIHGREDWNGDEHIWLVK